MAALQSNTKLIMAICLAFMFVSMALATSSGLNARPFLKDYRRGSDSLSSIDTPNTVIDVTSTGDIAKVVCHQGCTDPDTGVLNRACYAKCVKDFPPPTPLPAM